jgi:hypothetical protein
MGTTLPLILHINWFTIDTQSFNSLGQNPCAVTAYLMATCYGGGIYFKNSCVHRLISSTVFNIDPLTLGDTSYSGPSTTQVVDALTDACFCNTVVYNLISACSECQGGEVL